MSTVLEIQDVMTLEEAAAYLRVTEEQVERLAGKEIPARQIEGQWRILRSAVDDWLRNGKRKRTSREVLMDQFGALADDPYLEDMLKQIYRERGRPESEED
ncbi:MAG: helix-turn-helix domain-containing protein [Planctomycetes bacterium]|nr:helix-turn-helix domain-containing protein [Planctomycetota bacterium]